jgi:hypothetical protein
MEAADATSVVAAVVAEAAVAVVERGATEVHQALAASAAACARAKSPIWVAEAVFQT